MIEQRINEEYEAQKKATDQANGVQTATAENTRTPKIPEAVKKASYTTSIAKK